MKTAIWLYLFMFVAFFDLHAQYPILTPFAVSLGAAPSFIGLMMGMYSLTHLPGNMIAGYTVDRFGSRLFIVGSLLFAGLILLLQSAVTDPWQLLVLRSVSGFVLAFLSPACMALLASMARNQLEQGKLMAGNGVVHTVAAVISPAAGAFLVAQFGFAASFHVLGVVLVVTALCALLFIREGTRSPQAADADRPSAAGGLHGHAASAPQARQHRGPQPPAAARTAGRAPAPAAPQVETSGADAFSAYSMSWIVFALPVAMACAQGILSFELPLLASTSNEILTTGLLFSVVSLGALITLSMLFLNRYSPFLRTLCGALVLAVAYFAIAAAVPVPFYMLLFVIGVGKGIIFPALSSLLIQISGGVRYGRTFSALSIAFSVGAFLGPLLAGHLRDYVSPYFIAFVFLMLAVSVLPLHRPRRPAYRSSRV